MIEKYGISAYAWLYLVRREFLLHYNLRFPEDVRICEDNIFSLKLFLLADTVLRTNLKVYVYTIHPESTMSHVRSVEHLSRVIENLKVTLLHINDICVEFCPSVSAACHEQCVRLRDSIGYFMILRCIRIKKPYKEISRNIEWLRGLGVYPFHIHYGGKFNLIEMVLNCKPLLRACSFVYRLVF